MRFETNLFSFEIPIAQSFRKTCKERGFRTAEQLEQSKKLAFIQRGHKIKENRGVASEKFEMAADPTTL
jgi:hypothetical protein